MNEKQTAPEMNTFIAMLGVLQCDHIYIYTCPVLLAFCVYLYACVTVDPPCCSGGKILINFVEQGMIMNEKQTAPVMKTFSYVTMYTCPILLVLCVYLYVLCDR